MLGAAVRLKGGRSPSFGIWMSHRHMAVSCPPEASRYTLLAAARPETAGVDCGPTGALHTAQGDGGDRGVTSGLLVTVPGSPVFGFHQLRSFLAPGASPKAVFFVWSVPTELQEAHHGVSPSASHNNDSRNLQPLLACRRRLTCLLCSPPFIDTRNKQVPFVHSRAEATQHLPRQ